ncbi:MAG: hypothetical protein GF388_11395 [Candidatus Aegiribacteria sp.]|nr:hypothetical protein [Candidatus Aegiribacteria sp.]MBD3295598.1 hypothetical protein [Candidatus Fermentibacteria bacterium]
MKITIFLVLSAFLTAPLMAVGLETSDFSLIEPTGSWFNPEFSGYTSFSLVSGGGRTLGSGVTVGTMEFALHPDWDASIDVGYARLYDFSGFSTGRVLGGLDLRWKPSDDFTLQFHVSCSLPDSSLTGF